MTMLLLASRNLQILLIVLSFSTSQLTDVSIKKIDPILHEIISLVESKFIGLDRCRMSRIDEATKPILNPEKYFNESEIPGVGNQSPLMIQTVCFSHGSLGNSISEYVEARICAQLRGYNYIAAFHTDPTDKRSRNNFFDAFPSTVRHESPSLNVTGYSKLCPCESMCHEWSRGLMHSNMKIAKSIFRSAIDYYWEKRLEDDEKLGLNSKYLDVRKMKTKPIISRNGEIYKSNTNGTYSPTGCLNKTDQDSQNHEGALIHSLPIIPEVAIHYRCGDNVVTHYGFLPFRAYSKLIPKNTSHIYILAESPERNPKANSVRRCGSIFAALNAYLTEKFPSSITVILRGHDIIEDLARLTYANITICSVSTFCLWPAISSDNAAYYPVTKLIAKEDIHFDYGPSFHWMTDAHDAAIRGVHAIAMTNAALVKLLQDD